MRIQSKSKWAKGKSSETCIRVSYRMFFVCVCVFVLFFRGNVLKPTKNERNIKTTSKCANFVPRIGCHRNGDEARLQSDTEQSGWACINKWNHWLCAFNSLILNAGISSASTHDEWTSDAFRLEEVPLFRQKSSCIAHCAVRIRYLICHGLEWNAGVPVVIADFDSNENWCKWQCMHVHYSDAWLGCVALPRSLLMSFWICTQCVSYKQLITRDMGHKYAHTHTFKLICTTFPTARPDIINACDCTYICDKCHILLNLINCINLAMIQHRFEFRFERIITKIVRPTNGRRAKAKYVSRIALFTQPNANDNRFGILIRNVYSHSLSAVYEVNTMRCDAMNGKINGFCQRSNHRQIS